MAALGGFPCFPFHISLVVALLNLLSPTQSSLLRNSSHISPQCLWAGNNHHLFFHDARKELGFQTICPSNTAPFFMNFSHTCLIFSVNGTVITYARAYKVNSINIIKSLLRMDDRIFESSKHSYLNHRIGVSTRSQWIKKIREEFHLPLSQTRSFGFYRDPLSHFISGIRESHFRFMCEPPNPVASQGKYAICSTLTPSSSPPLGSMSLRHLIEIIHTILSCQFRSHEKHLRDILHISPQGQTVLSWKPQFIGYLETFDQHWQELLQYLNISIPYVSPHTHASQSDPYQINVAFLQLFDLKPQYHRAICRFVMIDYICLGFKLPPVCSHMLDEHTQYVSFMKQQNAPHL
jgi:hypothetical protein